uniref:NR LBD domain-containing protein n=2 Tax=Tetranychus urticae TaxID=32264 RepID=T1KCA4_TETUR
MLDGFEAFALQEAAHAIRGIVFTEHSDEVYQAHLSDLCADPRPVDLVSACQKSRAFRKLHLEDKIELLKNAFFDLNAMKNIINFDPEIDGLNFCGVIYNREKLFTKNLYLRKKAFDLMDTFPNRFRTDINVCALLFLIIIFNPDLPELKYRYTIKSEQYVYIYLLRRYLVSCIEPICEALDYFYQLMTTIEEIRQLKIATEQEFDTSRTNGSYLLKNRVVRFIELGSVQQ